MSKYNLDEKTGIASLFTGKNLNRMVKVGSTLEIKHFKMFEYLNAYVVDKTENTLKMATKELIQETFFFPGDHVAVNYSDSKELYVITGEIKTIHSMSPLELTVTTNHVEKLKDLRKYERYYVSLMANINIPGLVNRVFAVVKNLSTGGIKVNCSEYLSTEETMEIEVVLDRTNKMTFTGAIVRREKCKGYFEYGIEIRGISESNLKCLHHYINWLSSDYR
ncbi:PilZ domain-containing protein [Acetivibrio cellulolyticus]|uniref:PilZ domain-containing protein n=1 Tax=Acetivibrio cellulolyticus TaxID=35830 RepID=UPI0001E2E2B4|nr:PilZ domain-containing protein [Acetivibrio cellulolyticus]